MGGGPCKSLMGENKNRHQILQVANQRSDVIEREEGRVGGGEPCKRAMRKSKTRHPQVTNEGSEGRRKREKEEGRGKESGTCWPRPQADGWYGPQADGRHEPHGRATPWPTLSTPLHSPFFYTRVTPDLHRTLSSYTHTLSSPTLPFSPTSKYYQPTISPLLQHLNAKIVTNVIIKVMNHSNYEGGVGRTCVGHTTLCIRHTTLFYSEKSLSTAKAYHPNRDVKDYLSTKFHLGISLGLLEIIGQVAVESEGV